jgi:large subunit ribosomal protein L13
MPTAGTKSYVAKTGEVTRGWHLVDATDVVLGRMATRLAEILMGKHKPEYTPHVDTGDFIVVVNAEKVKLTGSNKREQRTYGRYSYYPGGYKEETLGSLMERYPDRVVEMAVRRMLPKTKLGRVMLKKLKVYRGNEHPHQAQQPETLTLN